MLSVLLCLLVAYELPDADRLPRPDAARKARVVAALAAIREGGPDEVQAAVRDLALVGEPALRAVVARLNEADARERLLLLTAVRPIPRAAPLLEQAREDGSPAVRAWVAPPPPPAHRSLEKLAHDYLEALAVVEERARREADEDAKRAGVELQPPTDAPRLSFWRDGMSDRKLGRQIEERRRIAAQRFAVVGGEALQTGKLEPRLDDPVFLAYLALLREENVYYCVVGLTGAGPAVAPALKEVLARPNHKPARVLRVLFAVEPEAAGGVFARRAGYPEDTQRALVALAPVRLPETGLDAWLADAAESEHESVRRAALRELLARPAPAGRAVAARLLDPERYGAGEFRRATRLLARAGDLEPLVKPALMELPDDNSAMRRVLDALRRECRAALKEARGPALESIAVRLLRHESPRVRALAVEWSSDPERLLAFAAEEPDRGLAETAALRALREGGAGAAERVLDLFRARGMRVPWALVVELRELGRIGLLLRLAHGGDESTTRYARSALARLEQVDARWEEELLALGERLEPERAIDLLLTIGTEEAHRRLEALVAGNDLDRPLLTSVAERARVARPIPLERFLEGADAERLERLVRAARAVREVEPGLFARLFRAWDALAPGEREGSDIRDSGPLQEQIKVLARLAESTDIASARTLFADVLEGRIAKPELVLGVLRAAAKLLAPGELAPLIPRLRTLAAGERAKEDGDAPAPDRIRRVTLFFGLRALAWARTPGTPALCAELFLDPRLHAPAFDWEDDSGVGWWALNALRHFPRAGAEAAFRAALARAEADGRLARMHPATLRDAIDTCRFHRDRGRRLAGVGAALAETLRRLPWEDETEYLLGREYGALRRYDLAARAMRADAARKRRIGFRATDGFWTAERVEERARVYDALATRDEAALKALLRERLADRPQLSYWAGIQALWHFSATDAAAEAFARAVRRSAGLYHPFRDWLAGARLQQGRTAEALRLLDPDSRLPVRRDARDGYHLLFTAQAHARLGETSLARQELELAMVQDRRVIPVARRMPEFRDWDDVFAEAEDAFFRNLFEYDR